MSRVDSLIIGAGPSGLAAAIALRRAGVKDVLVVEREQAAGGIPRHCHHTGFGMRDLHRVLSGPDYARRYVQMAQDQGVEIRTETMVTNWVDPHTVRMTSPSGTADIQADAIVLATGCRERPRAARLVPGSRPAGIFTAGSLQQWVYLRRLPVGKRAVVVGAEHVSFSAVMTLKHAGVEVAAMVTEQPQHQSYFLYKLIAMGFSPCPIITNHHISNILGKKRVQCVEITSTDTQHTAEIECDTVVFTGDWIPDHELARLGRLTLDPNSKGPQVDTSLRTSAAGVFAVGNVNHAAETADVAALSGRSVAGAVLDYLDTGKWREQNEIQIEIEDPIQWISPHMIALEQAQESRRPFYMRVNTPLEKPAVEIWQGDRLLWRRMYRLLIPNLPIHIPPHFLRKIQPEATVRFLVKAAPQQSRSGSIRR